MNLTRSETESFGEYSINQWKSSVPNGTMNLDELKIDVEKITIPTRQFTREEYPSASADTYDEFVPAIIGTVTGGRAYNINRTTGRFKFASHSVNEVTKIYREDGSSINPNTLSLVDSEFTYLAWQGEDELLFVDVVADYENPVDAIEALLTDDERGAGIDAAKLENAITLSHKGFGSLGARNTYFLGTNDVTGEEITTMPVGLWVGKSEKVNTYIKRICENAFCLFFANKSNKFQVVSFAPETSADKPLIDNSKLLAPPSLSFEANKPITRCVASYGFDYLLESGYKLTELDDNLRLLRGIEDHATAEFSTVLTSEDGARLFAQQTVYMRGRPQRLYKVRTTPEFILLEPGDYVRLQYTQLNINEMMEVLEVSIRPGTMEVSLTLTDNRAWQSAYGSYGDDVITFPSELGGTTITAWDYTWSDAQKQWANENVGFWNDDNGYLDDTNDALKSFGTSNWF